MQFHTYLTFSGNCRAAFTHYAQALGGRIEMMQTYGESPMADQTPPDLRDKIMHTSLKVGDALLMGSDAPPQYQERMGGFSVSISVQDPNEAERVFNALARGGNVRMPLQETFWAQRFGMLVDQFGVPWMVNCEAAAATT